MRLIDADSIKFTEYLNGDVTVSKEKIQNTSTAFDLESVIEQLEEKKKIVTEKANYYSEKSDKYGNRGLLAIMDISNAKAEAYKEALEILKTAANATNGKNGG